MVADIQKQDSLLVSVVMPAYNAEKYIEQAIRSVLSQSVTNWELIVVDDCSQDNTSGIVEHMAAKDCRIKLVNNEKNLGVAKTRNKAMDLCKGTYVAFLDSDDTWHPEKLSAQIARMEQTDAKISYCSYAMIDESGETSRSDYLVPGQISYEQLLIENVIGCSTVMLHCDIAAKYRFRTDFYHEDYVMWLQILRDGYRAAGCPEVLVDWRYIKNSRSFNKWRSARNRWRIYRNYLKLPVGSSLYLLGRYMLAGVKKYHISTQ